MNKKTPFLGVDERTACVEGVSVLSVSWALVSLRINRDVVA